MNNIAPIYLFRGRDFDIYYDFVILFAANMGSVPFLLPVDCIVRENKK